MSPSRVYDHGSPRPPPAGSSSTPTTAAATASNQRLEVARDTDERASLGDLALHRLPRTREAWRTAVWAARLRLATGVNDARPRCAPGGGGHRVVSDRILVARADRSAAALRQ